MIRSALHDRAPNHNLRITKNACIELHELAEQFLVGKFRIAAEICMAANRLTLTHSMYRKAVQLQQDEHMPQTRWIWPFVSDRKLRRTNPGATLGVEVPIGVRLNTSFRRSISSAYSGTDLAEEHPHHRAPPKPIADQPVEPVEPETEEDQIEVLPTTNDNPSVVEESVSDTEIQDDDSGNNDVE
jgi:histone H3/H4